MAWVPDTIREWLIFLEKNEGHKVFVEIDRETGIRTPPQNNALHLGLDFIAKALNDAGFDMRKVLKPEIEIPWSTKSAKDFLFRPVMKMMTGKESTTELSKQEVSEVWDTLMKFLGEKHHVEYISFPSEESKPKVGGTDIPYPQSNGPTKF